MLDQLSLTELYALADAMYEATVKAGKLATFATRDAYLFDLAYGVQRDCAEIQRDAIKAMQW